VQTHSALQALKAACSGLYCGPLRLLAMEVFDRLNGEGLPCALLTGQERIEKEGARHTACTVEMASVTREFSVAVIDEIQARGLGTRISRSTARSSRPACPAAGVTGC